MRLHPLPSFLSLTVLASCLAACSGPPRDERARERVPALEVSPASAPAAKRTAPLSPELQLWIAEGRALLAEENPAEAEILFAKAAARDGGSLRTRMWVLRAWMDQGRSDETLAALEGLERDGMTGPEMAYLYGMAFTRRAEGLIASGKADSSIEMCFLDATDFLEEALEAGDERYPDALPALARAAWQTRQLETARAAADRLVEVDAGRPESWLLRGRIALSQFVVAHEEAADAASSERFYEDATSSFGRAVALLLAPANDAEGARLAEAARELGNALLWKQNLAEATDAFATAIAWAPDAFDYGACRELLAGARTESETGRPIGFRAALEEARARFEARAGADDPRAGTFAWWVGYACFAAADWRGAEEAFLASVAHGPRFTNGWFYLGLARQYGKDHEGALAAMHAGWDVDPTTMIAAVRGAGGSLDGFEGLIGWCVSQEPPRNLEAAFLADMLAQAFPDEPRHWNNLGLFLRDEGERLEIAAYKAKAPEPDSALLDGLYQRSFAAYERALALQPDDPQLLNDTTLMLDYHSEHLGNLDVDVERIEGMYRRTLELLDERLAATDLTEEDRARFEQTKEDVNVNLERLREPEDAGSDGTAESAATPVDSGKP